MCDYSLMHEPNRLAEAGETLTVHRFPSGSLGFVNSEERAQIQAAVPQPAGTPRWTGALHWLVALALLAMARTLPLSIPSLWALGLGSVLMATAGTVILLGRRVPETPRLCAVCVPPGARLLLLGIPERIRRELGVSAAQSVTFVQLHADENSYRDAVQFASGRTVLVQQLAAGQTARVLALTTEPEMRETRLSARMLL